MPENTIPSFLLTWLRTLWKHTCPFATRSTWLSSTSGDQTAMTARQLLSILRLSQALARLRFSDLVAREDVDEAIRLTHEQIQSCRRRWRTRDGRSGRGGGNSDVMSRIFNIIRDYATTSRSSEVELKLCEAMVLRKGFTIPQLQSCLEEYEALDVIQVNSQKTLFTFFMAKKQKRRKYVIVWK